LVGENVLDFDVSPDGETLILLQEREGTSTFSLRPRSGGEDEVIEQAANVILRYPRFSPDGRYIAFLSWENRSPSTYIRELRGDGRWVLPDSYESRACWNRSGDALIYNTYEGGTVFSRVSVQTSPVFKLGPRVEMFRLERYAWFDVGPEGDRLLIVRTTADQGPGRSIAVVQNWWAEFAE
jgi:Tol biopolymer transport system component